MVSREFFAKKGWADYYLKLYGDDGRAKGWLDAKAYIATAAFTKAHGTKLLIANLPELHDVQHYSLQKIADETADQNGVPFVDLLPYVQGVPSPELWVTRPDPYPNGLAHKLFAHGIFEALEKLSVDETETKAQLRG